MTRRYLFILEIAPVEVGKTYDELPSHLTLMSRFFSELSPQEIATATQPVFAQMEPIELTFGKTTELGPKKLTVHMVEQSAALRQLHNDLHNLLDSLHVEYEYPQFSGPGHKPHVTQRKEVQFAAGDKLMAYVACLIEVIDGRRVIRSRARLAAPTTT